jgi:hypothetical protein
MKNGLTWIGVAVAVLGIAAVGGLLLSRGGGSASSASTLGGATSAAPAPASPVVTTPASLSSSGAEATRTEAPAAPAAAAGLAESTGSAVTAPAVTTPVEVAIIDLIKKAAQFEGKVVTVKGQVLTQCMAGCEFSVDDGTGTLNVKLEGEGMEQLIAKGSVTKKVVVTGLFVRDPRPQIIVEKAGGWHFQ